MCDHILIGLEQQIHSGKPVEAGFLLRILQKCKTREETEEWIAANDFSSCISPAEGYQSSLSNLHTIRMNCPLYRGMIYLDWGMEQPRKQADFKGSFGGRLTFHCEKGVPQLAKRQTVFSLKESEHVKYTVTWVNLMEEADPAASKQFRVARICHEKSGPRSYKWMFHSDGKSPFGTESGKHIALAEWSFDRTEVETFCQKMEMLMESFEEVMRTISGYLILDTCSETHIEVKPKRSAKSKFDDSTMQTWIKLLNQMLGEELIKLLFKETRVLKPDLHLYMVLHKEIVSEGGTQLPVESETELAELDSFEDFEFDLQEPLFLDEVELGPVSSPLFNPVGEGAGVPMNSEQPTMPPWNPDENSGTSARANEVHDRSPTHYMPGFRQDGNLSLAGRLTAQEVSIRQDGHLFLGGGADILQLSDGTEKENIEQMGRESYKKILNLQTYFFSYKKSQQPEKRAGFIAQQVKEHIEEAVTEDAATGLHYISLGTLIPFIVQGLQEQDKCIEKQGGLIMLILGALLDLLQKWEREFGMEELPEAGEPPDSSGAEDKKANKESKKEEPEEEDPQKELFCKFLSNQDRVSCLVRELEEESESIETYFRKFVETVDAEALWKAKEQAKQKTSLTEDGSERSKGGEFIKLVKLHKKNLEVRKTVAKSPQIAVELRSYQRDAVQVATEGWDPSSKQLETKNFCFVAPTGSGKTRIFMECIRNGLVKYNDLKAVVIIPNIALSKQHEGSFMMSGFGDAGWRVESYSSENSVNRTSWPVELEKQSVMIMTAQIFLNLLDDGAAHMEQIDLLILDEVHHAKSRSPYKLIMEHYNRSKGDNKGYLPKVLGFSASPANHETLGGTYKKLTDLRELLQAKLVLIPDDHREIEDNVPTPDERVIKIEARQQDEDLDRGIQNYRTQANDQLAAHLRKLIPDGSGAAKLAKKFVAFFSETNGRLAAERYVEDHPELSTLSKSDTADLLASAQLLQECENALVILKEFGFERALAHCAQKCIEILDSFKLLLGASNAHSTKRGVFKQLVIQLCNTAPVSDSRFITSAIGRDIQSHGKSFPKFVELLQLLENDYVKEKEFFHGMIFIETRAGVHHLAHMLRSDPRMKTVKFIEFTGHGSSKKSDYANVKGMTGKMQEKQLRKFREQGRKILVATQAAEEGLDISDCEFVIRYTAPKTGIQRVQSKGRTRKEGSVYVSLITKNSLDEKLEDKARVEEVNLQKVMKMIDSIIIE